MSAPEIDCELCEKSWFLARPGLCDRALGVCVCDEGFSGNDDFFISQTCSVNDSLAKNFHLFLGVLDLISIVACTICFIQLLKRFYRKSKTTPVIHTETNTEAPEENLTLTFSKNERLDKIDVKVKKIKQMTLTGVFFLILASGFAATYHFLIFNSPEGRKRSMEDAEGLAQIFGVTHLLSAIGFGAIMGTWSETLPSPKQFAEILGYDGFLRKYPQILQNILTLVFIEAFLLVVICFFIIPFAVKNDPYELLAAVQIGGAMFSLTVTLVVQGLLIRNVKRAFRAAIAAFEFSVTPQNPKLTPAHAHQVEQLKRAIKTADFFFLFSLYGVLTPIVFIIVLLSQGFLQQFLWFNMFLFSTELSLMGFPLGILYRTNGGLRPLIAPIQYVEELQD